MSFVWVCLCGATEHHTLQRTPEAQPNEPVAPLEDRLRVLLVKMKERSLAYDHHDRDTTVQMAGSVLLQWHGHLSELLPEE